MSNLKEQCQYPYVSVMNDILSAKRDAGMFSLRMFVQSRNQDISIDDLARDFCNMEFSRPLEPSYSSLDF